MGSNDRITPYKEGGSIEDRIDEIVAGDAYMHFEMMSNSSAWMRIGDDIFDIYVQGKKLVARFRETQEAIGRRRLPEGYPTQEEPASKV